MPYRLPIDADLWMRLAALDARCDFLFERGDANRPSQMLTSRKNYERESRVEIWETGKPEGRIAVDGGGRFSEALRMAVETAEGKGWDTRKQSSGAWLA